MIKYVEGHETGKEERYDLVDIPQHDFVVEMNRDERQFELVDILGHYGLFTDDREGFYYEDWDGLNAYYIRGGFNDDLGIPATIEDEKVAVNFFGIVLMADKIDLPFGYLAFDSVEEFAYCGMTMTVERYRDFVKEVKEEESTGER